MVAAKERAPPSDQVAAATPLTVRASGKSPDSTFLFAQSAGPEFQARRGPDSRIGVLQHTGLLARCRSGVNRCQDDRTFTDH
jgi:hypothetical protein